MVKTKRFVLEKAFQGLPKESDFKLLEEDLPLLKDGEILCEAVWFSVDPFIRNRAKVGGTMIGSQVAKITRSCDKDFPVGRYVVGYLRWQTITIHNPKLPAVENFGRTYLLPDFQDLPLSLALGIIGMPGNSAYFGFLEICKPKKGETVVVSGAAGAVGSIVGQIARIKGCRVIGFAGSDSKVEWLKNELHFDAAYNYKTDNLDAALKEAAPNGVDCYFDNVGGTISSVVMSHMNQGGRISVCGYISLYNEKVRESVLAPVVQSHFVAKQLTMQGFLVYQWWDRWQEGIQQLIEWVKNKQIVYRETVSEGFETLPAAFIGMLQGQNTGKAIVKA